MLSADGWANSARNRLNSTSSVLRELRQHGESADGLQFGHHLANQLAHALLFAGACLQVLRLLAQLAGDALAQQHERLAGHRRLPSGGQRFHGLQLGEQFVARRAAFRSGEQRGVEFFAQDRQRAGGGAFDRRRIRAALRFRGETFEQAVICIEMRHQFLRRCGELLQQRLALCLQFRIGRGHFGDPLCQFLRVRAQEGQRGIFRRVALRAFRQQQRRIRRGDLLGGQLLALLRLFGAARAEFPQRLVVIGAQFCQHRIGGIPGHTGREHGAKGGTTRQNGSGQGWEHQDIDSSTHVNIPFLSHPSMALSCRRERYVSASTA